MSKTPSLLSISRLRALPTRFALSSLLAMVSPWVWAQGESTRWYQVEIAVFTQPNNSQLEANTEQFRKDVNLSFGGETRHLRTLKELLADIATQNALDQLVLGENQRDTPQHGTLNTPALPNEADLELTPAQVDELLARTPLIKLPETARGLNDTIGALARRNRQRILFHEAWRQPLGAPEEAISIIVQGGEFYGDEQELGGTIALGAARYLHLKTNLWMAEFAQNYGQGDLGWPNLPTPPAKHPSAISDDHINLNAGSIQSRASDLWQQTEIIDNTYQSMLTKPYVVTRLATLQQDRRMRSGEVHYIDHPIIGIMVLVTPYELPKSTVQLVPAQDLR